MENLLHQENEVFAEIIIPLYLPVNYTWSIPLDLISQANPGVRVEVSLRNKRYTGIIKRTFKEKPSSFGPKPIFNIVEEEPLIYPQQLQLWQWISDYYMCTEGEVMQAAIPSNLKLSSETILIYNEEEKPDPKDLDDDEFIVTEALEIKKELRLNEVQQLLSASHVYPVIKRLIAKNICYAKEELIAKYKDKKQSYITLQPKYHNEDELSELLNNWSKAPKQLELLLSYLHLLKTEGEVTQNELLKKSGATLGQLKSLVDKNILSVESRSIDRIHSMPKNIQIDFDLSDAQQLAFDSVLKQFNSKTVCLLHGITSSGKTQIYIKLIEYFFKQEKQALYMLPEIALTAQIIRRLQKHFGGNVAIYHSKLHPNERVEIWNKIKNGEIKAVLGARSALFLPFKNLGLIIIDEEHDASYKQQEPAPRYHAGNAAIYYASLFNSKVLLGSATPSVETYYNCKIQKYGLIELNERYGNIEMPEIKIIDVKNLQQKNKEKIIISSQLKESIENALSKNKQVILFQNRRGYTPYLICRVCGWLPQCKNCDVTLTLHKAKNKLVCHYCGTTYPLIINCPACGSHNFIQKNFGTEKIEEAVAETFQQAKIQRMDYDSVKGKYAHDTLIKLFELRRIDILVGTQMVVKGLDFDYVSVVGILDADGILHFTDFRVNERAFQLMEQVSGRAGRKEERGEVIIQAIDTKHPVLQFVQQHNYHLLYDFEINNRRQYFYPPFSRMIQIVFKHKENTIAEQAAYIMLNGLKISFKKYISGPAQPVVSKIRNQYIWELLLKLPRKAEIINQCKREIHQQITIIQSNKIFRSVMILPDVDPVN